MMDDGGVLFDKTTWKTHILTASAALVYETLIESNSGQAASKEEIYRILQNQLQLNPSAPEATRLLAMLNMLGIVR
ncbi:MAG: HPr-rel-A system PqqD family peptide chaperone [Lamprobacter sp.]|uniref:HPr-rel-A system PqqD family peptide chaperone n=1 Tax=Lamprobacter sp. TaxID=3100796 RepID=UPI002B258EA9|nr:HPr-rel-A system PqqD family peptide chaperone [Lamprobacter sp.]MEA3642973.1 HPr-rel-A system PqqD family peptide chaperone [Lamprobacter sp.]